jgi:LmbE family N-acetylglucosaminyl deacetylase
MTIGWINRCRSKAAGLIRRLGAGKAASPGPWPWLRAGDSEPRTGEIFTSEPVLVLAPHPDDEVVGPGGTIRRHVLAGAPVQAVVLTDGKWGGYNPDGSLVGVRKKESLRAAEILGMRAPIFLDQPDGSLTETPALLDKLAEIYAQSRPKFIYLPALTDEHHDHWATNRIFHSLLARMNPKDELIIRGYEVWTPAPANRLVDITLTAELKREAIGAFVSQISTYDYVGAVLGLNHYRALRVLRGHGFAEAFMEMNVAEFCHYFGLLKDK